MPLRLLACLDGSQWSCRALQFVCRRLAPEDDVVLLAVCQRGGESYLECGRMQLEMAVWSCAGTLAETRLRLRLAVGDPRAVVPIVAAEERADLVVTGSARPNEPPYGLELAENGWIAPTRGERPILVGSPRGIELVAGEESLLVARWREVAPLSAP